MTELEVIDDFSRLCQIQDEWFLFAGKIANLTPFQLPQWLLTWWLHFGSGRLQVLVFRRASAILAIIPCFHHQWQGRRQMTLIGSGISDYLEPAILPEHIREVLDCLRAYLEANPDWDICDWQDLSGDSSLKQIQVSGAIQSAAREDIPCSEIRLTGTFEEFWRQRPKELRQNVRRDRNRAEMANSLEFTTATQANPELLQALIQLHGARWEKRGESGAIAANGSAEFLRDVAFEFARLGILQFFTLRFGGKISAAMLTFLYANTVFFYLSGFDPEHGTLSLGSTLLFEALGHCFEKKYDAWNFLRGSERYKFRWGAQSIPKCRLILTRQTQKSVS